MICIDCNLSKYSSFICKWEFSNIIGANTEISAYNTNLGSFETDAQVNNALEKLFCMTHRSENIV